MVARRFKGLGDVSGVLSRTGWGNLAGIREDGGDGGRGRRRLPRVR